MANDELAADADRDQLARAGRRPVARPGPAAGREPGAALPRRRPRADERQHPGKEFTVQEVVERSGQSLRSFYQYFGGKHELLLALFEESVRSTAEQLLGTIESSRRSARAAARLRRRVLPAVPTAPTGQGTTRPDAASVMAEFAQQLLTEHPPRRPRAFAPAGDALRGAARRRRRCRRDPLGARPPPDRRRGARRRSCSTPSPTTIGVAGRRAGVVGRGAVEPAAQRHRGEPRTASRAGHRTAWRPEPQNRLAA